MTSATLDPFDFNKVLDKIVGLEEKYNILFGDILNKPLSTLEEVLWYINTYSQVPVAPPRISDMNALVYNIKKASHFISSKFLEEDFI